MDGKLEQPVDASALAIAACLGVANLAEILEFGLGDKGRMYAVHQVMRRYLEAGEGPDGPQAALLASVFAKFSRYSEPVDQPEPR